MSRSCAPRPLTLPTALLLDAALGEPPAAVHPVVGMGRVAALLERGAPTGPQGAALYGALLTTIVVGGAGLAGWLGAHAAGALPWPLGILLEGWLLKTTLSVRALIEAGHEVELSLEFGDLPGARAAVASLVSRDASVLSAPLLASAAVESLAENTADSIVAPLLCYAVGGLPSAFAYRAVNTLDAMIGYRGRYEHLGKAAARLDDALNLLPARLSAGLLVAGGAVGGGDLAGGIAVLLRDHRRTASPNAGWPMSAMAGLLGVRLEKAGHYVLGAPLPQPDPPAIDHAVELVKAATLLSVPTMLGLGWLVRRLAGRCGRGLPGRHPSVAPGVRVAR
jgi:adenosylcobinamide-phosphate synthase